MVRSLVQQALILMVCVFVGILFLGFLGAAIDGHGPPPFRWDATPKLAKAGAVIGGGVWLFYWLIAWYSKSILGPSADIL